MIIIFFEIPPPLSFATARSCHKSCQAKNEQLLQCWFNTGPLYAQRLRHWPNIKLTLAQYRVRSEYRRLQLDPVTMVTW